MKLVSLCVALFAGSVCLAQTPVDIRETVVIGGIEQYITIKGKDASLPLFLFLHGGPGGSVMNYADNFSSRLQDHFLVIQWDQRQTGRTRQHNRSRATLSLALFQNDTQELIEMLLKRYKREKLYLAGHSWGTALGFHIARKFPHLLYAYIPIGPMISQLESERIVLTMMKEKAARDHNEIAVKELASVRVPFGNGEQLFFHRKWLANLAGSRRTLSKQYVEDWAATWLEVFNEASKDDLLKSLPAIGCPVYFFAGRKDYQTNSAIAEKYYLQLTADKKGFYWFENSGHSIPSSEPDRMQEIIIETILPETFVLPKTRVVTGEL